MKIGRRLTIGFSSMLVLIVALITLGINSMSLINKNLDNIVNIENVRSDLAYTMGINAKETAIMVRNIIIYKFDKQSDESIIQTRELIAKTRAVYLDNAQKLKEFISKDNVKLIAQFSILETSIDSTWNYQDQVIRLVLAGKLSESADLMIRKAYPHVQIWISNINEIIRLEKEISDQSFADAKKMYSRARTLMFTLGIFSIVLAVTFALLITLSITKPLKVIADLVLTRDMSMDLSEYQNAGHELALMIRSFSNDISTHLKLEKEILTYRDQLEELVRQRTLELSNVLLEVKETVNIIASSSAQILAATTQVAAGTAETASALSETTITVEEVQQAAKLSSQKAKNVAESAQKVMKASEDGQKAVEETVAGMNRIREQMESIAQTIVRLSDQVQAIGGILVSATDIADQSNLLAVNAAIEAARAGEMGKGFTVVAQEIRNLAGQSKHATNEVRKVLTDVQKATAATVMAIELGTKAVHEGVKQSSQAGEAIHILSECSNDAVQAAIQIGASSRQQEAGLEQIGIAMQNINQAGTETAVSMIQSEKSAKNLYDLGQKLKDMVEQFKE